VPRPARDRGARTLQRRLQPLPRRFFARPTEVVAPDLIGKLLMREAAGVGVRTARIVEVEAYLGPRDQASHARRGPTPRAAIMFGPPGHLYVYLIYGKSPKRAKPALRHAAVGGVAVGGVASAEPGC
jgi:hypothetical protein